MGPNIGLAILGVLCIAGMLWLGDLLRERRQQKGEIIIYRGVFSGISSRQDAILSGTYTERESKNRVVTFQGGMSIVVPGRITVKRGCKRGEQAVLVERPHEHVLRKDD